jgi:hypothetical protein
VNRVFVRLGNEPVPTGQRDIGTRLLSPFENRQFSDHKHVRPPWPLGLCNHKSLATSNDVLSNHNNIHIHDSVELTILHGIFPH